MADDIGAEFAEFIKWRDAQRARAAEADFEVPIFEKGPDGTERSVTLPFSQAKALIGKWWPDLFPPEGSDDGGTEAGAQGGATGATNPVRDFFAGGKRQQGGAPPARSA